MRALLLDSVPLSFGGGYERFLVQLAEHLEASGHATTIVTPRRGVLTKSKLARPGRENYPHSASSNVLGGWTHLLTSLRSSDVLYLKNEPHELMGLFALRPRVPVVVGMHSAVTKVVDHQDLGSRVYGSSGYGHLLRRADHIHALQAEQAEWCIARHHVGRKRVSVVPNGVDLERFRPAERRHDHCRLLFVGRLDQHKGVDVLLSAVREIAQRGGWAGAALTVAGDGPLIHQVRQLARDLPHIEVLGYVEDVALLMQEHDVLVVPSRWEAMALVPLEGLASGMPLVVSDLSSFSHLVGEAVLRTQAGDPADLARAIGSAIDEHRRDRRSWEVRVAAARALATGQFGSGRSFAALVGLLQRCAEGQG